jgi:uncharacterized membrane protein/YHS domain-containing protein
MLDKLFNFLTRRWLLVFTAVFGVYVWTPFLAPVLMKLGLEGGANLIYTVYSFLCHQLPERSFFLFGPKSMYSLTEIQAVWGGSNNLLVLRQFTGTAEMGWKVAWSDRMVYMFASLWLAALLWRPLLSRVRRLPWWGLGLLLLPMFVDGTTHFISDLSGIGEGFRSSNAWLASLTGNAFSAAFYAGDAFASFNSWMRLLTGLLFGAGVVWFAFPFMEQEITTMNSSANAYHSAPRFTACGSSITGAEEYPSEKYRGIRIFFCEESCRKAFLLDPERYLAGEIDHSGEAL